MTVYVSNPAEPVVDENGSYGGFAEVARRLTELHPERSRPFSRQLVNRWYTHREYNAMPEKVPVRRDGKVVELFDLREVEEWHKTYRQHRRTTSPADRPLGGVMETIPDFPPPIDTIPLFQVDSRGEIAS